MGKSHDSIQPAHREFIEKQHIFFVSTAPLSADGHVNLSPKGLDCFRVLSDNNVRIFERKKLGEFGWISYGLGGEGVKIF